jgi:ketosteroid isomerase-like protein
MHTLSCVIAWIAATILVQQPRNESQESAHTKELFRLENVWNEAYVRGDANALDSLWADDFVATVPNMTPMTKAETIGIWRSGRMKFLHYETSDLRVRVYGDAAVVTGRVHRIRNLGGRDVDDHWRFTKVYVHRAGRWQVVAWHASTAGD